MTQFDRVLARLRELKSKAEEQIRFYELHGLNKAHAVVAVKIPGRWGKRNFRQIWPGGPEGEIVAENHDGTITVMVHAVDMVNAVDRKLTDIRKKEKGPC